MIVVDLCCKIEVLNIVGVYIGMGSVNKYIRLSYTFIVRIMKKTVNNTRI